MEENKEQAVNETTGRKAEVIDLREVFMALWKKKKLFLWVWLITGIVSVALIFPVPRTYVTELTLAPELGGDMGGNPLASLAGSFGFNLNNMEMSDAFYPELYPDVIETNDFIVGLFSVPVRSLDGEIKTDYYTYLTEYQKKTFYLYPFNWLRGQIKSLFVQKEEWPSDDDGTINPRMLTEQVDQVADIVRNSISCSVDKKTQVITIQVEDQDPLICADMADTVRVRLQEFITSYRTNKARHDQEYYKQLADSALLAYQQAVDAYSAYADSHQNSILQYYISQRDELENQVQIRLQAYTAMNTQYETAKAKVQERTPAFTILKAATVPLKPAKPKRMLFVLAMLVLASFGTGLYIFRKDVFGQLTRLQ